MSSNLSFFLRQFTGSNDLIGDGKFNNFFHGLPDKNAVAARPAFDSTTHDGGFVNFVACPTTSTGNGHCVCGRGEGQQARLRIETILFREEPFDFFRRYPFGEPVLPDQITRLKVSVVGKLFQLLGGYRSCMLTVSTIVPLLCHWLILKRLMTLVNSLPKLWGTDTR